MNINPDAPVRIDRARLWEVALPLQTPFVISGGVMRVRRSLIVELHGPNGKVGYGESAPFELPFYSSETVASARALLSGVLLPRLVGRALVGPGAADEILRDGVRGNPFARAGAETAVWDLCCAAHGQSLVDLMVTALRAASRSASSVAPRRRVECGVALGIPEDRRADTLRRWTREALAHGYRRVKIKVRPGWDVAAVRAARAGIADAGVSVPLWVDANGAFDLERDAETLRAIDGEGLLFIEQPLQPDDLVDHAALARRLHTPICLDESLHDERWGRHALVLGASRIWNVKVQRMGGITEALRLYLRGRRDNVDLWGGTMPETGIGAQAMLALGSLPGFVYPSDVEPSTRWYGPGVDLVDLTMDTDGTMAVPRERGLAELGVGDALARAGQLVYDSGR